MGSDGHMVTCGHGQGQVTSLNQDLAQGKGFSFQEVYISLLQLAWSCSGILWV